jgi:hypothetical protein
LAFSFSAHLAELIFLKKTKKSQGRLLGVEFGCSPAPILPSRLINSGTGPLLGGVLDMETRAPSGITWLNRLDEPICFTEEAAEKPGIHRLKLANEKDKDNDVDDLIDSNNTRDTTTSTLRKR